jgi:hypothetical protein
VLHTDVLVDFGKGDTMPLHSAAHNAAFPSAQQAAAAFTNPAPYAPALGAAGNAVPGGVRVLGAHGDPRAE